MFAVINPLIADHSPDKSDEGSSSYADVESVQQTGLRYDVCSRSCRHRFHHLSCAGSYIVPGNDGCRALGPYS